MSILFAILTVVVVYHRVSDNSGHKQLVKVAHDLAPWCTLDQRKGQPKPTPFLRQTSKFYNPMW